MSTISPLHADKYAINMAYAHYMNGSHLNSAVFDLFYRKPPFGGNFAIFAGRQRIIDFLTNLRFTDDDIGYLRWQPEDYSDHFLEMLMDFRFTGDVWSAREGAVIFPNEPIVKVRGTMLECLLVEAAILNFVNFQSLIATKAARIRLATDANDILLEMGTRRAQEADAAIWGARAAFIGGFNGTSNMLAGKKFGIPTIGTMAHAWVLSFDDELEAFRTFASVYPDNCTLLVDTYDTITGIQNAITVAKELEADGHRLRGIRLDSGDLLSLSKTARRMLDDAGLYYVKIVASNDLDEQIIMELKDNGAKIDIWGVGTKLITADPQPAFGGVYKLVERYRPTTREWKSVVKFSETPEKTTLPGDKVPYRFINDDDKFDHDLIALASENVDPSYDRLIHKVIEKGDLCVDPDDEVKLLHSYCMAQLNRLPDAIKDINRRNVYEVRLSNDLVKLRDRFVK